MTLGAHLLMILLTCILLAAGYNIVPINFEKLPLDLGDDSTKRRTDAWLYVRDDPSVVNLVGNQNKRVIEYQPLTLYYEDEGNVFTKANLLSIKQLEDELFNITDYQNKLCQLEYNNLTSSCKKPLSILRFFDGSYRGIDPTLYDPDFENISAVLNAAQRTSLSRAILNFHLGKNSLIEPSKARSKFTRTLVYFGWPIEGFNNTDDRDKDQEEKIDKRIVDVLASKLERIYEDGVGKLDFVYTNRALSNDAIVKQVVLDMMLAVASFVFIFIFMWLQTGSLWITAFGIFCVVSSFNIANLIYRILFDYRYFGIFHVLSIFIVLGIGADDVFVFMDTWKQSENTLHQTLAKRLSKVYKRAAKATLITSFTTMMAFLSNVTSPLLAISSFGLFSAILIIVNYLSFILFFPTVIIMHHRDRNGKCFCWPMCSFKPWKINESTENVEEDQESKTISQRIAYFFEETFVQYVVTHKITRWVVFFLFTVILSVSIGFASQLEPDTEQV